MPISFIHHPSSYRDPSGFIFEKDGVLYRQVNKIFSDHFDFFIRSGLYEQLAKTGKLIPHENIKKDLTGDNNWHETLKPEKLQFISFPYEWSFYMLKDAALLTLELLKEALKFGMVLKDASPYNIQWHNGKLIFIDTLSFEKYDENMPWIAYRQFCEFFLSPLLLAHHSRISLHEMLLAYSDGIPLAVTKSLLPWKTKYSIHTYLHIHLHAKYSSKKSLQQPERKPTFSKQKLLNLVSSLETLIKKLKLPESKSTWSAYYDEASQRDDYLVQKQTIIQEWLEKINPITTAADLGANKGEFSRLLASRNIKTIAADFDANCINFLYNDIKKNNEKNILPLIIDLSKPSPAIGVNNEERNSFICRTKVDLIIALALIHHLAIGKNIPFKNISTLLHGMCNYLIIEFVPKEDEKVKLMLLDKKDIFPGYNHVEFLKPFQSDFTLLEERIIGSTDRTLFLLEKKR